MDDVSQTFVVDAGDRVGNCSAEDLMAGELRRGGPVQGEMGESSGEPLL
jgi:hypothetical protein